jgi:hypothetical protein
MASAMYRSNLLGLHHLVTMILHDLRGDRAARGFCSTCHVCPNFRGVLDLLKFFHVPPHPLHLRICRAVVAVRGRWGDVDEEL